MKTTAVIRRVDELVVWIVNMLRRTYCLIAWTYICFITVELTAGNLNSINGLAVNATSARRHAPVTIKPLNDGLLVINSGDLRARVAAWTILVNIDPPDFPNIWLDIRSLEKHIEALKQKQALPEKALMEWTHRLTALQYKLHEMKPLLKRKEQLS